jgi:hypothetical protein
MHMHMHMHVTGHPGGAVTYPAQQFSRTPPPRLSEAGLRERFQRAFPELAGAGQESESGAVLYGDRITAHSRPGAIPYPSGFGPEQRDAENAEREQRWAAMSDGERALAEAEAVRAQGRRL